MARSSKTPQKPKLQEQNSTARTPAVRRPPLDSQLMPGMTRPTPIETDFSNVPSFSDITVDESLQLGLSSSSLLNPAIEENPLLTSHQSNLYPTVKIIQPPGLDNLDEGGGTKRKEISPLKSMEGNDEPTDGPSKRQNKDVVDFTGWRSTRNQPDDDDSDVDMISNLPPTAPLLSFTAELPTDWDERTKSEFFDFVSKLIHQISYKVGSFSLAKIGVDPKKNTFTTTISKIEGIKKPPPPSTPQGPGKPVITSEKLSQMVEQAAAKLAESQPKGCDPCCQGVQKIEPKKPESEFTAPIPPVVPSKSTKSNMLKIFDVEVKRDHTMYVLFPKTTAKSDLRLKLNIEILLKGETEGWTLRQTVIKENQKAGRLNAYNRNYNLNNLTLHSE